MKILIHEFILQQGVYTLLKISKYFEGVGFAFDMVGFAAETLKENTVGFAVVEEDGIGHLATETLDSVREVFAAVGLL